MAGTKYKFEQGEYKGGGTAIDFEDMRKSSEMHAAYYYMQEGSMHISLEFDEKNPGKHNAAILERGEKSGKMEALQGYTDLHCCGLEADIDSDRTVRTWVSLDGMGENGKTLYQNLSGPNCPNDDLDRVQLQLTKDEQKQLLHIFNKECIAERGMPLNDAMVEIKQMEETFAKNIRLLAGTECAAGTPTTDAEDSLKLGG